MLAHGLGMFDSVALAYIIGTQASLPHVIADRHALTTPATENQSLQQCRAFTCRAPAPIAPHGLRALVKPLLIVLIIFPGHIAGVGPEDQRLPLLLRERHDPAIPVDSFAAVVPPKDERAGIAWIVQDPQHLTMPRAAHTNSPLCGPP